MTPPFPVLGDMKFKEVALNLVFTDLCNYEVVWITDPSR